MAMCIHSQEFETCSFGCTFRSAKELRLENDRFRETLSHIAENGCAKCGNVAELSLQDIDPNYEQALADSKPESPK